MGNMLFSLPFINCLSFICREQKSPSTELEKKPRLLTIVKISGKLAVLLLIAFVSTFAIYFLNLENKLIYHVVTPFLNSHYDKQVRDRRI